MGPTLSERLRIKATVVLQSKMAANPAKVPRSELRFELGMRLGNRKNDTGRDSRYWERKPYNLITQWPNSLVT